MGDGQKIGLFTFLEDHLDYRIKLAVKVVIPIVLVVGLVFLWNYVRDLQNANAANRQAIATLQQGYQQLGANAVTKNEIDTQKQADAQASQLFGSQVTDFMKANNSRLNSLTSAVGTVAGQVNGLQQQALFKPGQQDTTSGALTGYTLEENRGKLPPTSAVNLSYNPKEADPNKAFLGTTWQHYTEQFNPVVGQWEQDKTHGYKTTVKLSRTVSKPDPNDATKMIVVGTEDIPMTDGSTIYSPNGMKASNAFYIPRWTATVGFSKDGTSTNANYQPSAMLDYRITNKFGATAGVVNKAPFVGLSVRFGAQK